MSVHGEYSRALEALLASIRQIESAAAAQWVTDLEAARISQHGNLSAAAESCVPALDRIGTTRNFSAAAGVGPDSDPLREPTLHLLAHCRTILGRRG